MIPDCLSHGMCRLGRCRLGTAHYGIDLASVSAFDIAGYRVRSGLSIAFVVCISFMMGLDLMISLGLLRCVKCATMPVGVMI